MKWWKKWRAERRRQRLLNDAWKPGYNLLAQYNSEVSRGVQHAPEYKELMERLQHDYDTQYMPLLRA